MNVPAPDARRQKHAALIGLLGVSLVLGIIDAAFALPSSDNITRFAFTLIGNVALLVLGFRWLQLDGRELDIRRPVWLNVGIILLAAAFVPYYLYKTRPDGQRTRAIVAFAALVFGCVFASMIGALLMGMISGSPMAAPA